MKVDLIVKTVILNRKLGKILLVQRCDSDETDPGEWEQVGGNMEKGETPEEAIQREVFEETGIANIKVVSQLYTTYINKENPYLILVFLCETETEEILLSEEHQNFKWADKQECLRILRGGIKKDYIRHKIVDMDWEDRSGGNK